MKWQGVIPAMTTAFDKDLRVDHEAVAERARWMVANGCTGVVLLGSLGESPTLTQAEKIEIVKTVRGALTPDVPVVAGISGLGTAECVDLAKSVADAGGDGLMVLPPYVYRGDWREIKHHVTSVMKATSLSCMLYNNPVSYGTDFTPEQIVELAMEQENMAAVKESSTDVRRVTSIQAITDRLAVLVGVDDVILESVGAGAVGWIAGLVNALPAESVRLFELGRAGRWAEAYDLYRWFLPLLRLDTMPKFIQLVKLVEERAGVGSSRVRAPRLELAGTEREDMIRMIDNALANRPAIALGSNEANSLS
jgi:4-hydroxy-tetrahydrodipicolinate synthase